MPTEKNSIVSVPGALKLPYQGRRVFSPSILCRRGGRGGGEGGEEGGGRGRRGGGKGFRIGTQLPILCKRDEVKGWKKFTNILFVF
jgi:hypothetical protein